MAPVMLFDKIITLSVSVIFFINIDLISDGFIWRKANICTCQNNYDHSASVDLFIIDVYKMTAWCNYKLALNIHVNWAMLNGVGSATKSRST